MAEYLNGGVTKAFLTGSVNYANGGYVQAYVAGTTTPTSTYNTIADAVAGINPQEWPAELDSQGQRVIAINGATDVFCYDADGNELWSVLGLDSANADIIGPDGSIVLHFIYNDGAVNGWSIENATTGVGPIISTYGSDTNIPGYIKSKGSSPIYLDGGDSGKVILGATSTGDIELRRNVVATGTVSQTTSISSATTSARVINPGTPNQGYRILGQGNLGTFAQGSTSGSYTAIPSGYIGEILRAGPNTLPLAPSVDYNLQVLDLTPGNWRLDAYVWADTGGGTVGACTMGISSVSGFIDPNFRATFGGGGASGSSYLSRVLHVTTLTRMYMVFRFAGTANANTVASFWAIRYS